MRTFVQDRSPGADCQTETSYDQPGVVVCTRTAAPATLRPGEAAEFVSEICAVGSRQTIRLDGSAEVVQVLKTADEPFRRELWESDPPPGGPGAHDLTIERGYCARYATSWSGRTDDGRPLRPGGYELVTMIASNWTTTFRSSAVFEVR